MRASDGACQPRCQPRQRYRVDSIDAAMAGGPVGRPPSGAQDNVSEPALAPTVRRLRGRPLSCDDLGVTGGRRDPISAQMTVGGPFVGRERELADLRTALDATVAGRGGLIIAGCPAAPCARARSFSVAAVSVRLDAGTFRACVEHRWLRRGLAVAVGRPSRHLQRRSTFGARSRRSAG